MSEIPTLVLKLGGRAGGASGALAALPMLLRPTPDRPAYRVCIVHGGGPEVSALLERLGEPVRFKDGLRVTDDAAMRAATMVLRGWISTGLVRELALLGVSAVGLSGVDGGMVLARPHPDPELGAVGEVARVATSLLTLLLDQGLVPLVAPLALDAEGTLRNINADTLAGALAGALEARQAVFLTDVPGVLDRQGRLVPRLRPDEVEALIADATIHGGMLPKVRACLSALAHGARAVSIADGRDAGALPALLAGAGGGTVIEAE